MRVCVRDDDVTLSIHYVPKTVLLRVLCCFNLLYWGIRRIHHISNIRHSLEQEKEKKENKKKIENHLILL